MPRRIGIMLAALALLAGCAGRDGGAQFTAHTEAGAAQAWDGAFVILPGDRAPQRLAEAAPRLAQRAGWPRLPVVILAHGCRGFDGEAAETLRLLAAHGFAAVAPDHLARADGRRACGMAPMRPLTTVRGPRRDAGYARPVTAALPAAPDPAYAARRIAEVGHALAQLRDLPWADPDAIYLIGHSLGRGTAGLWPTRGLAAVAVLGQDCRSARAGAGFDLPLTVPLLPLADRGGAVDAERARALHCGEHGLWRAGGGLLIGVGTRDEPMDAGTPAAVLDFLLGVSGRA